MYKEVEGQKKWMALDLHADDGVLTRDEALVAIQAEGRDLF